MNTHSNQHQQWSWQSEAKEATGASNEVRHLFLWVFLFISFHFFYSNHFIYGYEHPLWPLLTIMTIRGQKSDQSQCWGTEVHPFLWVLSFLSFYSNYFNVQEWTPMATNVIHDVNNGHHRPSTQVRPFFSFFCSLEVMLLKPELHSSFSMCIVAVQLHINSNPYLFRLGLWANALHGSTRLTCFLFILVLFLGYI